MKKINTLNDLTKEKRDYIETHYMGENDKFVGIFETEEEAYDAARKMMSELQAKGGWDKGEIVEGKEVEFVSIRVDHQDDSFNRGLKKEGLNYVERIKVAAPYFFYVCSIARRFVNPLNNIPPMVDDDINGWVPADAVKVHDDVRDQ